MDQLPRERGVISLEQQRPGVANELFLNLVGQNVAEHELTKLLELAKGTRHHHSRAGRRDYGGRAVERHRNGIQDAAEKRLRLVIHHLTAAPDRRP